MGIFKYKIDSPSTGISLTTDDAPEGWKDDESIFPRSKDYIGIFRKFSANTLTFHGESAKTLRDIEAINGFESEASFTIYELDLDTYESFIRFTGDFDFTKFKDVSDNGSGLSYDILVIDSAFWNKIRNRQDDEPQLTPAPDETGVSRTLDGFPYTGYTNEEQFITLPEVPIVLNSNLDTSPNAGNTYGRTHAVPLIIDSQEDPRVKDVTSQSTTSSSGAFYIADEEVNNLRLIINYGTSFEVETGTLAVQLVIEQFRSGSFDKRILATATGDEGDSISPSGGFIEMFTDIEDGDYWILYVEKTSFGSEGESLTPYNASVRVQSNTVSQAEIEISGMMPHEAVSRLVTLLTNVDIPVYSEILGRTDSEPRTYSQNGELSQLLIINGKRIRGFTKEESPLKMKFKDFFQSFKGLRPIGAGIEEIDGIQNLRIEAAEYFYDNRVVLTIDDASNITKSPFTGKIHSRFAGGFRKAEYEEKDGIREYNQGIKFSTPISVVNNEYRAVSVFRMDDQGINNARAKAKTDNPTLDTRYDTDNFMISLITEPSKILNGNFEDWIDDNDPKYWSVIVNVQRKELLGSNRCYFIPDDSGFFVSSQIIQSYNITEIETVNLKFSYENIGITPAALNPEISPYFFIRLDTGGAIYDLQSDGTWVQSSFTQIYFDLNIPVTPESQIQSLKSYSFLSDPVPELGIITFSIASGHGFIVDDVYIGQSKFIAETDENFQDIQNAINGTNSFNLNWSPARNLRRHGLELRGALDNKLSQSLRFNSTDKDSTLRTLKDGESEYVAENEDVLINDLGEPYFEPTKYEFDMQYNKTVIDALNSTFAGETKPKYLGLVKWRQNTSENYKYGWIEASGAKTGGQSGIGSITLLSTSKYITPIDPVPLIQLRDDSNSIIECGSTYILPTIEENDNGSRYFEIESIGTEGLTVDDIAITGTNADKFTIDVSPPFIVGQNQRQRIIITGDSEIGDSGNTHIATLTIESDSETNPSCILQLEQEITEATFLTVNGGEKVLTGGKNITVN